MRLNRKKLTEQQAIVQAGNVSMKIQSTEEAILYWKQRVGNSGIIIALLFAVKQKQQKRF